MPRKSISTTAAKNKAEMLKHLVRELKAQNSKLQQKVARLEAECITARNRIKALEKQKLPPPPTKMSDLEIARRIAFALNKGGLDINGKPIAKRRS
jgi:predicted nuclease with TOPRIM domain